MEIQEGYMPYLEYHTYYRIAGRYTDNKKKPLIVLHGGPGCTHTNWEVLDSLAKEDDRIIITYDQLGCGNSLVEGHPELWRLETWMNELELLIQHLNLKEYHLLGHSWGGMLAMAFNSDKKPSGIKSVILSSSLSDSQLWGREQHRLISYMNEEDQKIINNAEKTNNFLDDDFKTAEHEYIIRYCKYKKTENLPECLYKQRVFGYESYNIAWGPCEFTPLGNLKDFNYTQKLTKWNTPSLIISGTDDECTPLIAKTMYDAIPNSKWELLPNCRHTTYIDNTEKYISIVKEWLNKYDN